MPRNDEPIRGKIAEIVTDRNVVINRGSQDGIESGMRFQVRLNIGIITDPEDPTNTLGELSFTKARLKVTTVYDRMSYCQIESRGLKFAGEALFGYPDVDSPLINGKEDWVVRRGDKIEEIRLAAEHGAE